MGRRKKLTQEQIDWRNSILKGKVASVRKAKKIPNTILTDDDKIRKCFFYLNNCVFWVNEYIEGRSTKLRLLEIAKALQGNAKDLELLLTRLKNNEHHEQ